MDSTQNSKNNPLGKLLLKLFQDQVTGVVTIKDDKRAIRIYLKQGHIVYTDGIDKEGQLIKEIGIKKKLDPGLLGELKKIKEADPQSLGKTLLERNIISSSVWGKFLELKVKHTLISAFEMDSADMGFSSSELKILPVNFLDYNILQLLLDTLRGIKNLEHFKKNIFGDNSRFALSEDAEIIKAELLLNPSEQTVLSMIDKYGTVEELITATGLDNTGVQKILILFHCLGIIDVAGDGEGDKGAAVDFQEIVKLYLDLLRIIEVSFQKEIGKEFENIFDKCKKELRGQSSELLKGLNLSKEGQDKTVDRISGFFADENDKAGARLALLSSFNKLVYLLIMRMKKMLGTGLTEKAIKEMMNILDYVKKYRQDTDMIDYVKGNLTDYLHQISS